MQLYEGAQYPFSVQIPASWNLVEDLNEPGRVRRTYQMGSPGPLLIITETDLSKSEDFAGGVTLDQAEEKHLASALAGGINPTLILSERRVNVQGDAYHVFVFREGIEIPELSLLSFLPRLIYVYQEQARIQVEYIVTGQQFEELWPMIDYTFNTFVVLEGDPTPTPLSSD